MTKLFFFAVMMIIIIMCRVYLSNTVFFAALERSYLRPLSAQLVTVIGTVIQRCITVNIGFVCEDQLKESFTNPQSTSDVAS